LLRRPDPTCAMKLSVKWHCDLLQARDAEFVISPGEVKVPVTDTASYSVPGLFSRLPAFPAPGRSTPRRPFPQTR